jgi:hypothetical protein
VQGLACGYYGIFGGLVAGLGIVWFGVADRRWRQWRFWALASLAAILAMAVIAPFFAPYVAIQEAGFSRSLEETRRYSADWRGYLVSPLWIHRPIVDLISASGSWGEVLFPGFLPIGFAAVAILRALRRRQDDAAPLTSSTVWFYATLALLAGWASFGPDAGLYTLLHEQLPFFSMLRAPSRFGLLVTMAIAILGGAGLAGLERRLTGRTRRLVVGGVIALAVAQSSPGGLSVTEIEPLPLAYERLASLPRAPVAEFPFWIAGSERHRHTEYMLWSTYHWQPLINGYSDHIPAEMFADMQRLATFPAVDAWRALRDHQARYVVIHWQMISDTAALRALADAVRGPLQLHLRAIVDRPDVSLFEIVSWP